MHIIPVSNLDMEEEQEKTFVAYQNGKPKPSMNSKQHSDVQYQCSGCTRWFPKHIVQNSPRGPYRPPSLPYSLNYDFTCSLCSPSGMHAFQEKEDPSFKEFCATALANLILSAVKCDSPQRYFSRDHSIVSFIVDHWDDFTILPPRGKAVVQKSVAEALAMYSNLFVSLNEDKDDPRFTLRITNFEDLNPHDFLRLSSTVGADSREPTSGGKFQKPGPKRKVPIVQFSQPRLEVFTSLKAFPTGVPAEFPTNKESYRYLLAECDRNSPLSASYIRNPAAWHGPQGRPIPGHMYRVFVQTRVLLSDQERAPQLKVASDGRTVTGEKGYSMVRATHAITYGKWYFEFKVLDLPGNSAVRAGWGTVFAVLQAPLGYDKFGYSYRSRKGTAFHESKGKHYAEHYGVGDVIGCYIELPPQSIKGVMPQSNKCEPLVKFKNHLYFEVKDDLAKEIQSLQPLPESRISFFKNGAYLGTAFENINGGEYFPTISLYKAATVRVNFGPSFDCPPRDLSYLPISERVHESSVDQTMSDILYSLSNVADFAANTRHPRSPNNEGS